MERQSGVNRCRRVVAAAGNGGREKKGQISPRVDTKSTGIGQRKE